jgi:F-type H+-transporting ATPase subunit epsilon
MADKDIKLTIIKPDKTVFNNTCQHVIIPGVDGDFGVSFDHTSFMTVIRPGILEIYTGNKPQKFAIHDGFVSVEANQITIVCTTIEREDEIDRERAEAARLRAENRLNIKHPETDFRRAETALKRALARLEIQ